MTAVVPNQPPKMFGVYVKNVSSSIGWGGQGGSCQMTLVEHPEQGLEIPKPAFSGVDPLNSPAVGTAVGFQYGSFSFGGILQRYTYKESTGGFTYDVVLESPAKLLDGIQVILDEFQGTTFSGTYNGGDPFNPSTGIVFDKSFSDYVHNTWNPFAELENFERGGIFGGAFTNSVGFPVGLLFEQLQKFGQGGGNFGGTISFGDSEYLIDFSEIIDAIEDTFGNLLPQFQYRIKGPVQSLNGILSDICEAMQYDYFAQIVGNHNNGGIQNPTIKIRALNRQAQPTSGVIRRFVNESKAAGSLISSSVGEEMQDAVTQRVVVGGDASRYNVASIWNHNFSAGSPFAFPVYGKLGSNRYVIDSPLSSINSWAHRVPVLYPATAEQQTRQQTPWPWAPIARDRLENRSNFTFGPGGGALPYFALPTDGGRLLYKLPNGDQPFYIAWLFELRMALGGQQCWEAFKVFQTAAGVEPNGWSYGDGNWPAASTSESFNPPWHASNTLANRAILQSLVNFKKLAQGQGAGFIADAVDITPTGFNAVLQGGLPYYKQFTKDLYDCVYKVASEYYGQVFMVPLPIEPPGFRNQFGAELYNNIRFIFEDFQYETPWEISDSAYQDIKEIKDPAFYDGTGKTKSVAQWPMKPNFSRFGTNFQGDYYNLGGDYAFDSAANIYTTKGGPDKDILWINKSPYAIVRTGAQVYEHDLVTSPNNGLAVLAQMFFGSMWAGGWSTLAGWNNAVDITAATIGPGAMGAATNGESGGSSVWTMGIPPAVMFPSAMGIPQKSNRYKYGPWYAYSSKKGKSEVVMDNTLVPETFGSLEALDEVARTQAKIGLPSMSSVESGSVDIAEFPAFNIGDRFAAIGPYVTGLNISIGTDGCKTSYQFKTYTPSFGKLAKYNIDRIARINKASLAFIQRERAKVEKQGFPRLMVGNMATNLGVDFGKWGAMGSEVMCGVIKFMQDNFTSDDTNYGRGRGF